MLKGKREPACAYLLSSLSARPLLCVYRVSFALLCVHRVLFSKRWLDVLGLDGALLHELLSGESIAVIKSLFFLLHLGEAVPPPGATKDFYRAVSAVFTGWCALFFASESCVLTVLSVLCLTTYLGTPQTLQMMLLVDCQRTHGRIPPSFAFQSDRP